MATNQISSQIIKPPENNYKNPSMKKENEEDISGTDDQEDVLSLCDLPVHTVTHDDDHQDNSNSNNSHQNSSLNVNNPNTLFEFFSEEWSMTTTSCVSKSSTPMNNHDNLFEFFSEEWNVATTNVATITNAASTATVTSVCVEATNTCGSKISSPSPPRNEKIIASQPQSPSNTSDHPKTLHQKTKKTPQESQEKKTSLIPWKSNSIFTKSMRDSKFLLVLFGLPPKIPTEKTELMTDIKIRQSRRAPFTFVPEGSDCGGEGVEPATISRREHILWRFIKAATCFGGQPRENGELDGSVNFVIPRNNSESKTS